MAYQIKLALAQARDYANLTHNDVRAILDGVKGAPKNATYAWNRIAGDWNNHGHNYLIRLYPKTQKETGLERLFRAHRRLLPDAIEELATFMARFPNLLTEKRLAQYEELLEEAIIELEDGEQPARAWHELAAYLAALYIQCVDPNAGLSKSGPAIAFVQSFIKHRLDHKIDTSAIAFGVRQFLPAGSCGHEWHEECAFAPKGECALHSYRGPLESRPLDALIAEIGTASHRPRSELSVRHDSDDDPLGR